MPGASRLAEKTAGRQHDSAAPKSPSPSSIDSHPVLPPPIWLGAGTTRSGPSLATEPGGARQKAPAVGIGPSGGQRAIRAATAERDHLIDRVLAVLVDDAQAQLRATDSDDLPAWALRHLEERAARGESRIDPARTSDLYARIRRYRATRGLDDEVGAGSELLAEAVLGPVPDDAAGRARYRALAAEVAPSPLTRIPAGRQFA